MSKRFWWQFMYWAKTGKRSWGYIFDKKSTDVHWKYINAAKL